MKILITGAGGMLGTELSHALAPHFEVYGLGRRPQKSLPINYLQCDLTHPESVENALRSIKPELIFHTAAMTQVDRCEEDREQALLQNVKATENLVQLANEMKSHFVFFSTDYVFDGNKKTPYLESDLPSPVNFYGETKFLAEKYTQSRSTLYTIFRVSWLFGIHNLSFPQWVISVISKQNKISVVSDQFGRPTYAKDVALSMKKLLLNPQNPLSENPNQIFHLGNQNMTSWLGYATFILKGLSRQDVTIKPILGTDLKRPATRPNMSVLDITKVKEKLNLELQSWENAVLDYLKSFQHDRGVLPR